MCHFAFGMNLLRPSVRFSRSVPETGPAENHPSQLARSALLIARQRTLPDATVSDVLRCDGHQALGSDD